MEVSFLGAKKMGKMKSESRGANRGYPVQRDYELLESGMETLMAASPSCEAGIQYKTC